MKLFTHAGYSRAEGNLKFRVANAGERADYLIKLGHTDVNMMMLPQPMSKREAAKFCLTNFFKKVDAEVETMFVSAAGDDNPFTKPKRTRTVTIKKSSLAPVPAVDDDAPLSISEARRVRSEFNARVKLAYEAN